MQYTLKGLLKKQKVLTVEIFPNAQVRINADNLSGLEVISVGVTSIEDSLKTVDSIEERARILNSITTILAQSVLKKD